MAFGCLGAFAQIDDEPRIAPSGTLYSIPADFTKSGKAQIIVVQRYRDNDYNSYDDFYVYDEGINLLATIHPSDACKFHYIHHGTRHYDRLYLTQTLFNDDDKYEYVRCIPHTGSDKNGIQIVSEDGTILQTLLLPENSSFDPDWDGIELVSFDKDNNYFAIYLSKESNAEYYFYKINKNPSDPSAVSVATTPIKLNVSPRLASRGEPIEVESQSGSMRQVVVTDAAGKVVYDARPAEGQRTVRIDSHRLGHGLNVVNVKHADGSGESCKILVK